MSSSYYALCTSHTPAITISADLGRDGADHLTTRDRFSGHDHCDIVIERVSGGPSEVGCPGTQLPGPTGCTGNHHDTVWIDVEWLRVLAAVTTPPNQIDPALLYRISTRGCWTPARIASLRAELGLPYPPPEPTEAEAAHAVVDKAGSQELHEAIRTLARIDPVWWDAELQRMARLAGRTDILGAHR